MKATLTLKEYYEGVPEVIKIVVCKTWIIEQFDNLGTEGIETETMFRLAERAGLYHAGVYGSVFSNALSEICKVVSRCDDNGRFLYNVFELVECIDPEYETMVSEV